MQSTWWEYQRAAAKAGLRVPVYDPSTKEFAWVDPADFLLADGSVAASVPLPVPAAMQPGQAVNKAQLDAAVAAGGGGSGGAGALLTGFGCACDGVTDDAAAVAALVPGTYLVPSLTRVRQLYVPPGVTLECGITATAYLKLDASLNPPAPFIGGTISWPFLAPAVPGEVAGCFGSSIAQRGISPVNVPGATTIDTRNYFLWASVISRGAVRFDSKFNYAVDGTASDNFPTQLATLLASSSLPRWMYIVAGLNWHTWSDWAGPVHVINTAFALMARGIRPIVVPHPPRQVAGWESAATGKTAMAANERLKTLCARLGILFVDPRGVLTDPASATGDIFSTMAADTAHQNDLGGRTGGTAIANQLLPALGLVSTTWLGADVPLSAEDVYLSPQAPNGNLVSNAVGQGTTGTLNGSAAGANVPTGYAIVTSNVTVTPTIVARTDLPANNVVLSFAAATPSAGTVTVTIPITLPPVGSTVGGSLELDIAYGGIAAAAIDDVQVQLVATPAVAAGNPVIGVRGTVNPGNSVGRWYLPDALLPSNLSALVFKVVINVGTLTGSRVIKLGLPALRIRATPAAPSAAAFAAAPKTWLASSLALPGGDVFTRASTAYQVDAQANARTQKSANVPRFDKTPAGAIIVRGEPARTNLITSFAPGNAIWDAGGSTIVTGLPDPWGGTTAFRVTGGSYFSTLNNTFGSTGRRRVWFRSATGQGSKTTNVLRDRNDSVLTTISETWTEYTVDVSTCVVNNLYYYVVDFRTGTATIIEAAWPQDELAADYASSPLDAGATRAADSWLAANGNLYWPLAGLTWVAEGYTAPGSGSNEGLQVLAQAYDGTDNYAVRLYRGFGSKKMFLGIITNGIEEVTLDGGVVADNTYFKVACRIQPASWAMSVNGGTIVTSATDIGGVIQPTALRYMAAASANFWGGGLARFDQVAPMTNGQLVAAST